MMKHRLWRRVVAVALCLVLILGLFSGFGVSAHEEVEIITPTRMSSTLVETAEALSAEIGTLPTTGALRNGKVRLYGFSPSADGKNEIKNLRGKHYIIREEADKFYILDGSWTGTNGNLPMKEVTMSARPDLLYIVSGYNPAMAFDFNYRGLASNGMPAYVLRFNNGRNLAVGSQYTGTYTNLYYVKQDTTTDLAKAPQIRFYHPAGVGWVTIRNVQGTHGLRQATDLTGLRWKDNSSGNNDNEGNALELYRPWSTRGIIDAIWDMRGYLDTPEFYDEATLEAFITAMRNAIDLFKQYNPNPKTLIDPYNYIQEKLDEAETELRSFADRLSIDIEEPSATELNATTKIHQLPIACGYVIQTRGGKIIVIDGGYQDNNTEGKYLFSYLQKITGKTKPHIDAWFLTHAHADHHGCVPTFADLYKNQVTIDAFYYHYPTYDQISKYLPGCGVDGTWAAVDWLRTWLLPNFKNAEGQPTKEVTVYTDQSGKCNNSFDFDEVHIDILVTFDDIMWGADNVKTRFSATSQYEGCNFSNMTFKELLTDNFNETSTIFRISAGGKNLLITGDTNLIGGYMLEKYHDAHAQNSNSYFTIKSDYVQVSHHGYCGLAKKTYQKIDPDVALFPTNSQEYNDTTLMNLVWHRRWFDEMGVTSVPAYQGPQVIEFPVVRSGGAVSIPAELKSLIFDAEYYSAKYADLAKLYGKDEVKLYYHFINYGLEEGRSASPFFDVKFYANQNGAHLRDTVKGNYGAAFKDFLSKYKTTTLLKLSEEFDASFYASNHKELSAGTNLSLLQHYVANGYKKGEIASNTFVTLEPNVTYHDNCTVTQPVAPTCTTAGKSGRVECKSCGLVLKEQTTVPAGDHSYSYKVSEEPTTSATGTLMGTCSLCSGTTTVTLPKLNTTDYTKTVIQEGSCTVPGEERYVWKNTDYGTYSFTVKETGDGHSFSNGYCTACGAKYVGTLLDFKAGSPELNYTWSVLNCCSAPTFDTADKGYMQGTISAPGGDKRTDMYLGMLAVNNPDNLNHTLLTADEVFQVRFKLDLNVEIPSNSKTKIYLKTGDVSNSTGYSETYHLATQTNSIDAEGFTTVTLNIPESLVGTVVETVRVDFHDLIGYVAVEGTYAVDYIYMGPACTAPTPAHSYTYKVSKEPTASATGSLSGTCTLCAETTSVTLPKLNETDYSKTTTTAGTCVSAGVDTYTWKNTDYGTFSFTVTTAVTGHTAVTDPAVAPTCTDSGLTEGSHCSVCGTVLTAQTVVPALGHSYSYAVSKVPAVNATGFLTGTCSACGRTTSEILPGLNETDYSKITTTVATCVSAGVDTYTWNTTTFGLFSFDVTTSPVGHTAVTDPAVAPTCTQTGLTEGTHCSACGTVLTAQTAVAALGHDYKDVVTAPTCGAQGYTTHTCTRCNDSYVDSYTQEGTHSYSYKASKDPTTKETGILTGTCANCQGTVTVTLPVLSTANYAKSVMSSPTCTATGMDRYVWKTVSYGLFYFFDITPAKGHTAVTDPAVAPTCGENGYTEGSHCSSCNAVLTAQEVIPALGHSYTYEKIDAQAHKVSCGVCGMEEVTSHVYAEGFCVCGEAESKEPVLDEALKLSHSLNLASDISINFVVPAYLLEGYDMSTVYVESMIENYEGETFLGTETVRMEPVEMGSYYYFTLTGITAVQMNDTIYTALYGEKDGQAYYSNVDLYSVAQYAYSQMNKESSSATLKTLCADLLRYGAKAQIYKEYRVSALADSAMTEEHKSYLSDLEAVTFGNNNADLGDLASAPVTWVGKTLDLDSKVCLKFVFNVSNYKGELSDLSLKVTYKDIYGETMEVTVTELTAYDAARDRYAFSVDALLASELREVVSVQIFAGDTPVSSTFQYSADTYGNGKSGTLLELCKALFAYSDSAKAYFAN